MSRERRGKFVYYSVADKRVVKVLEEAEAILSEVGAHVFRCTRYNNRPSLGRELRLRGSRGRRRP